MPAPILPDGWLGDLLHWLFANRPPPTPQPEPPAVILRPIVVWAVPGAQVRIEAPQGHWVALTDAAQGIATFAALPDGTAMPTVNLFIEKAGEANIAVPGYLWYGQVVQMPPDADAHHLWAVEPPPGALVPPLSILLPVLMTPTAPPVTKRTGIVHPAGGQTVADDAGVFHPLGMTFFWAYQGWTRDRDRFKENIEFLRPYGFDYVRIAGQVAWPGWEVNPLDAGYESAMGEVIDYLYDNGLRTELFLIGDPGANAMDVAAKIGRVCQNRAHKILNLEMANEYDVGGKVDLPTMIQMAQYLRANTPVSLMALSSPGDVAALQNAQGSAGTNLFTVHPERGNPDGRGWRQVRQGWGFKDFSNGVMSDNEPVGPHSSISSQTDPLILSMIRANDIVTGTACHILHVADMVTGQVDPAHNRVANLWEIANIDQILKVVRGVDRWLPQGIENWTQTSQHGGTDRVGPQPLLADAIWSDGTDHGVDRAYAAVGGGQFVEVLNGIMKQVTVTAFGAWHCEAYDPVSGLLIASADLNDQQTWTLLGDPDAHVGLIVTGVAR